MERMGIEYQRFNGKEYVSLRRYYNLQCKCKAVEEENAELKSDLSKFRDSFKKYRDYEKEELAESCYDLARENEKLKESLDIATKCSCKEEDGIIRLSEENKKLKSDLSTVIDERDNAFKKIEVLESEICRLLKKDWKKIKEEIGKLVMKS